jgi:hypothetical protein
MRLHCNNSISPMPSARILASIAMIEPREEAYHRLTAKAFRVIALHHALSPFAVDAVNMAENVFAVFARYSADEAFHFCSPPMTYWM